MFAVMENTNTSSTVNKSIRPTKQRFEKIWGTEFWTKIDDSWMNTLSPPDKEEQENNRKDDNIPDNAEDDMLYFYLICRMVFSRNDNRHIDYVTWRSAFDDLKQSYGIDADKWYDIFNLQNEDDRIEFYNEDNDDPSYMFSPEPLEYLTTIFANDESHSYMTPAEKELFDAATKDGVITLYKAKRTAEEINNYDSLCWTTDLDCIGSKFGNYFWKGTFNVSQVGPLYNARGEKEVITDAKPLSLKRIPGKNE